MSISCAGSVYSRSKGDSGWLLLLPLFGVEALLVNGVLSAVLVEAPEAGVGAVVVVVAAPLEK